MKINTQLTQDGYNQLLEELNNLKFKKEKIISEIEEVAQPDESGEDSLATQLKEELELLLSKIEKIETTLETAKIISGDKKKSSTVQVGSTVKIKVSGNSTKEFYIVSDLESDPTQNKISDSSPLGQALLGKKVNEAMEILHFQPKAASKYAEKVLRSAVANLFVKYEDQKPETSDLYVKEAFVNGGPQLKRLLPAPMGRAFRVRKRSNHLTIVVANKGNN